MVSDRLKFQTLTVRTFCLNPCCAGLWSLTQNGSVLSSRESVLILVVLDYGL